jgi:hypothetical protein
MYNLRDCDCRLTRQEVLASGPFLLRSVQRGGQTVKVRRASSFTTVLMINRLPAAHWPRLQTSGRGMSPTGKAQAGSTATQA